MNKAISSTFNKILHSDHNNLPIYHTIFLATHQSQSSIPIPTPAYPPKTATKNLIKSIQIQIRPQTICTSLLFLASCLWHRIWNISSRLAFILYCFLSLYFFAQKDSQTIEKKSYFNIFFSLLHVFWHLKDVNQILYAEWHFWWKIFSYY